MSSNLDALCWLLEHVHTLGADAADAVLFETVDLSVSARLGRPEGLERSESKGIGLRVFSDQRQAMVSTTDISRDALKQLAARAVAMARASLPDPDSTLAPAGMHPKTIPDLDLFDANEPSAEWLHEQCRACEDAARAVKGITNSEGADAHYSSSRISLAIANGSVRFAQSYPTSHFSMSVSVVAGEGTGMERDYEFTSSHFRSDLASPEIVGKEAARRALKRLNPKKVSSCQVPVVFDPRVSRSLLSTLTSAISGNAVARGSSFLKDSLGKPVFAKNIVIVDDPHMKRGLASKPFDAEGVANRKTALIENGVLKTWLLDVRSANKLKLSPTGHATRGMASPPSPSSSNLYMEKGAVSPAELIGDIKSGLYLTETFGMGINTVTGDYSQGASGFWIENGKIAYPVSEITVAGKLSEMFASAAPANDLQFRYATNAPTVRIERMTVAGT
jgi:PmbA protein